MNAAMRNDELKTACLQFIVPHYFFKDGFVFEG
ncbi:MAG: hypothetical protein QOE46_1049 [Acidobacteriota bacterium]|jgi:hypothetical protein|nr:hypothetical protein [Acidobacteriota bacterium]